ncbi:hypothetical protein PUW24_02110 [Paenibacillus urinalis]|uniref:Uncharacterized protein n=1 Tax=Paenibacillus urinalis TaxID=521520 RepID=A0ABY7X6N9_9BACL|nr:MULTISPECIES: hypothetical protein [Paenibacillus]WDH97815.1 hypothetical protein PUW24_02110 [Paenibacillus urinalis]WDI01491.1 hypothetical protein PUW25_19845 [Paenibacillus urinalis]GAK42276.1 hypothetical protein TCA2_4768 [Paenibacillus sp. TCA20]
MLKRTSAASLLTLTLVIFGGRFFFTYKLDGHILYAEYAICLLVTIGVLLYGLITEQRNLKNRTYSKMEMVKWSRGHKVIILCSIVIILLGSHLIYLQFHPPVPTTGPVGDLLNSKPDWFDIMVRFYIITAAVFTALRSTLVIRSFSRALENQNEIIKEDADHL